MQFQPDSVIFLMIWQSCLLIEVDEMEKLQKKKTCHICGNIVGGVPGIDFQYVKTGRGERYYCEKCAKMILKGG